MTDKETYTNSRLSWKKRRELGQRNLSVLEVVSRSFREALWKAPPNLIGIIIDKSWAHGTATRNSDFDITWISRGIVPVAKLKSFEEILRESIFNDAESSEDGSGILLCPVIDADITTADLETEAGKSDLYKLFEYNNRVSLILITNDMSLSIELAMIGVETVTY